MCNKTLVLYIFRTPSLRPCWTTQGNAKIQKRAPRCMRTLRRKKKRTPRCMGTLFVFLWTPNQAPPKSPKPFILNGLERFFANTEKHHLKTWNGRPRDIEKQSARAKRCNTRKTVAPQVSENVTQGHIFSKASLRGTSPHCMRMRFLQKNDRHAAWECGRCVCQMSGLVLNLSNTFPQGANFRI